VVVTVGVVIVRHGASLSSRCGQRAPTHREEASGVATTATSTAKRT
jgi:hypothetical protein